MGMFGWSYPPGCNGPPEGNDPSAISEAIFGALEDASIEENEINQACALWDAFEAYISNLTLNAGQFYKLRQEIKNKL